MRYDYMERLEAAVVKARGNLSAAQERYKRDFDKRFATKTLANIEPGDWVVLDPVQRTGTVNKLQPNSEEVCKVLHKGKGTVVIMRDGIVERVNRARVELAPPPTPGTEPEPVPYEPTPEDFAEKTQGREWVVDKILDHFVDEDASIWFHIRWRGPHADSWQPRRDLDEEMVSRYFANRKNTKRARGRAQSSVEGEPKAPPKKVRRSR